MSARQKILYAVLLFYFVNIFNVGHYTQVTHTEISTYTVTNLNRSQT